LKRIGEKGEGRWQRIPWETALDEIAEKLDNIKQNYGGEAIGHTQGTAYRGDYPLRARFFAQLGTSMNQAGAGNICYIPRKSIAECIAGKYPHYSVSPKSKCIVLLGAEPLIARPITAEAILDAKKRGAKLIVIDPRRTRSASMADVWLQIRPGTDCALLMGMVNYLIANELYDKEFVENWCHGFTELKRRAEEYPLEKVAQITELPAEKIIEAATVYAQNRPGTMIEGMGIEELQSNAEILHARWILAALVGNIDVEGGEEFSIRHPDILTPVELEPHFQVTPEQSEKTLGAQRFKVINRPGQQLIMQNVMRVWGKPIDPVSQSHGPTMYRAILSGKPYPVRGVITAGSNPMVIQPNTKLIYRALKSLDLYVVMDFWKTPSAELADYVLPIACWLERPILWEFLGYSPHVIAGEAALPAVIPGEYEHKTDFDVWRGLGLRLGLEKQWPWKNLEEYYDATLKPTGLTHNEYVHKMRCELKTRKYKKHEQVGFATPTGKVELYSTMFEKLGYDPLPVYREPNETRVGNPELAKEYPLTLITGGRVPGLYHSEWRQIDSVRRLHPYPLLQIHPDTSNKLNISEGDWVWIETPRGRVRQKATLFDGILPDVVHAEHGWWLPELPGEEPWLHGVWEVNINVCINDDPEICNQLTGAWPLRTALCKVYKVKEY
jgi:anaerobic selenocysteine-containing dehydrogenase